METSPSVAPGQGAGSADLEVVDALVRASFVTMGVLTKVAAAHDLSLTQLRVLAILRDHRATMGELAAYLGLDRSTISGLVDRAEKRGLLQRVANPDDGRGIHVVLTEVGVRLAATGAAQVAEGLAASVNGLSAAEARRLATLLDRLHAP